MNYYYSQLAGALGILKSHGVELNYHELDATMKRTAVEHGPDQCDTHEIKTLHRQYRNLCLEQGYIRQGELFDVCDCVSLV